MKRNQWPPKAGLTEIARMGACVAPPVPSEGQVEMAESFYQANPYLGRLFFTALTPWPNVIGPSLRNNFLAVHPAVLAKNAHKLRGQVVNVDHVMKANGFKTDAIIGHVEEVAYPEEATTITSLPPPMTGRAALFREADGVTELLKAYAERKHFFGMSVEIYASPENLWVATRQRGQFYDLLSPDTPEEVFAAITVNKAGQYELGSVMGDPLIWLYGGVEGEIEFKGIAVCNGQGADRTAQVVSIELAARSLRPDTSVWMRLPTGLRRRGWLIGSEGDQVKLRDPISGAVKTYAQASMGSEWGPAL